MRFTLPESAYRRQRSLGGTILSAMVHAIVIAGTLVASGISAEAPRRVEPQAQRLVYIKPMVPRRAPSAPVRTPPKPAEPPRQLPSIPNPVRELVVDPTIIPTSLPSVTDSLGVPFDSSALASSAAGGETSGEHADAAGDIDAPMSAFAVDREVVARKGVVPRYPGILANAGVEGTIVMQFVVDTLGRVERESIHAIRVDHPLFEQSVRDALAQMRFVPAEAAGRKVRQLVEQPFTFALGRR